MPRSRAATVVIPLPSLDFDPTEAAVSWQMLRKAGHEVRFATPDGNPARADDMMLTGQGLDLWGWVPGLRRLPLIGLTLRADSAGRQAYAALERDPHYRSPLRYEQLRTGDVDGLLLPGGHRARGMRAYLEDTSLQAFVASMFDAERPVAAICHGVVLAARSRSSSGRSVLAGRRTTALTWALERSAWRLMQVAGRVWDAGYYRTYADEPGEPAGHRSVEAEVSRALASPSDFRDVPPEAPDAFRKRSGLFRDRPDDERPAWVVVDGSYVSARWPGDAHTFARRFADVLAGG